MFENSQLQFGLQMGFDEGLVMVLVSQLQSTGAGHIIRISSKSLFISLIPFKSETCIMYTFIPHRLIYFKCLFLLILMIISDN